MPDMPNWLTWKNNDPRYIPNWSIQDGIKMPKFHQELDIEDACMLIFNMYPPSVVGRNCPFNDLDHPLCQIYSILRSQCSEYLRSLPRISLKSIYQSAIPTGLSLPTGFPTNIPLSQDDQIRFDVVNEIMNNTRNIPPQSTLLFVPLARLILKGRAAPLAEAVARREIIAPTHIRTIAYTFLELAKGDTPTKSRRNTNSNINKYLNPNAHPDTTIEYESEPDYLLDAMNDPRLHEGINGSKWRLQDSFDNNINDTLDASLNSPNTEVTAPPTWDEIFNINPDSDIPDSSTSREKLERIGMDYFENDNQFNDDR